MNNSPLKNPSQTDLKSKSQKDVPTLYENDENCCGCSACFAVCPVDAIKMQPDEAGFLFPVIDAEKCIRCYQCIKVCSFKEAQKRKGYLS